MPGETTTRKVRLGTRDSHLALWQANWTRGALERNTPGLEVELVPVKTSGDRILNVPLAEVGGKGLFTKELDDALLDGRIDCAVHSLKDLPSELPPGVMLAAVTPREDPRDVLVSDGRRIEDLPAGSRIGTSSLRRQAQLLHHFPALEPVSLRGNVDTRLGKLDRGDCDGILLAAAGLKRLGHTGRISQYLDTHVMLPAVGQGALALVCRSEDRGTRMLLDAVDDPPSRRAASAERALLVSLEGSCQVPIGGYARLEDGGILLDGLVASPDGKQLVRDQIRGDADRAEDLGTELGRRLGQAGADAILKALHTHGR